MKKKNKSYLFLGIFDTLAIGTVIAFLVDIIPEMDWSYGRSYLALASFITFMFGIFSLFGMLNVQTLYPSLDYEVKNNKEVLSNTPKNKKFVKIMNVLKFLGFGGMACGLLLYILTNVIFGIN